MQLYRSNHLETLFALLIALCESRPPADPLAPELVVVQNPGMGQWLERQWALKQGVACLLRCLLPAQALAELGACFGDAPALDAAWQRGALRWRILRLLPECADDPAFAPLAPFLHGHGGATDEMARFQLAGRIAGVFDQYQVYRPELLIQWEREGKREGERGAQSPEDGGWQAPLWRRLIADAPERRHRGQLYAELEKRLRRPRPTGASGALPERLHIFGVGALAPVYLRLFTALSRHIETHCYHLSPCRGFWHDMASSRRQAEARAQDQQLAWSDIQSGTGDNALLVQLGQAGRDFARQLLEAEDAGLVNGDHPDLYVEPTDNTLLARIQAQLLDMRPMPGPDEAKEAATPHDRSLELHDCFSELREVQALHDFLLDCFLDDPELRPGDILVAAPDISRYGAAVRAVFGEAPRERGCDHFIPFALADQPGRAGRQGLELFLALLDALSGRCTASDLLALLEYPALQGRLGLEPGHLPLLARLLRESGARWGLDAAQREDLGVAVGSEHSLRHGLDRLLLGYAMGEAREAGSSGDALHQGLAPAAPGGEEGDRALGALAELYALLGRFRREWRRARPAAAWPGFLRRMAAAFCDFSGTTEGAEAQARLMDCLQSLEAEWTDAACAGLVPPEVVRLRLAEDLEADASGRAFLSGRVTFCNMVPMRSLPFKVICLLGLNDGDFPRMQHPESFDLMARAPQLGDRNRKNDDRYLFLEAILSARHRLWLSWIGRDRRDGTIRPPSLVVSELMDYLDSVFVPEDAPETPMSGRLLIRHPLQPFSADNYNGVCGPPSFDGAWLPHNRAAARPFLDGPLPDTEGPHPPAPLSQRARGVSHPSPSGRGAGGEGPHAAKVDNIVPEGEGGASHPERAIDLRELLAFWQDPAAFFLRANLGMVFREAEDAPEEAEPFVLNKLDGYQLRAEATNRRLAGQDAIHIARMLRGQGLVPQGHFADLALDTPLAESDLLAQTLAPLVAHPLEAAAVDCPLDGPAGAFRLRGRVDRLYAPGRVVWSAGRTPARRCLDAWIHHLALALSGHAMDSHVVLWKSESGADGPVQYRFGALDAAEAAEQLAPWIAGFVRGRREALPFFPKSAFAWAEALVQSEEKGEEDADAALAAARKTWLGTWNRVGERAGNPALCLLFAEEALEDGGFLHWAELLLPMLRARETVT